MEVVLLALGRGLVKVLVSLFAAAGVGFLVFGIMTRGQADLWSGRDVPPELFIGVGSGSLTAAVVLLVLFWGSWRRGRTAPPAREETPRGV